MKKRNNTSSFPTVRLRRLRNPAAVRELLQETRLSPKDLIAPIFVQEGLKKTEEVASMPDVQRLPLSRLASEIDYILDLGIRAIILFGLPLRKDAHATSAFDDCGIVQKSIEILRKQFDKKVAIITDVCLCQYTSHGHCGLVVNKKIDNDKSIDVLVKVGVSHAMAGADIVAPSAMMDGEVQALRKGLDNAYSAPEFGDRRTYQMPFSNAREAMREIETDIAEGVDIVMIKPAIPYLDLVYNARQATNLPICAYSVSGEYALIKAAAINGWIDENAVMTEFLTSIKRAGANMIITYQAKKMAELLKKE